MKLPSLSHLAQQSTKTFLRFPFALIVAVIGTIVALITVNNEHHLQENPLNNIIVAASLGISLMTTIVLYAERRAWSFSSKLIAQTAGLLLLIGYAVTLPADIFFAPTYHIIRYVMLFAAVHFLAATAPFFGMREPQLFWQYNKTLFLRILMSVLYSGVLYIGLTIALAALQHLFGIEINSKRYFQLWIFIAGVFNTWFFLSGVPDNLEELTHKTDYPKGLKVFTQYVLFPLVTVYLVILYAYAGKIIIEHQWPQGWVSSLILGFSVAGILALLLVYPIKDMVENVWIRTVSKWYYVVLIPLDVMLLLAIWRRVSEYGVTESRYVVAILGFWLTAITLYFVLSKGKNIKVIPTSLCVIAFLSTIGPWGAFSFSLSNQMHRLESLLEQYHVLVGGKIQQQHDIVPNNDLKQISSLVEYINEVHGVASLQPWFTIDLSASRDTGNISQYTLNSNRSKFIVESMGLTFIQRWDNAANRYAHYATQSFPNISTEGYSQLIHVSRNGHEQKTDSTLHPEIFILLNADSLTAKVFGMGAINDSLMFDLHTLLDQLKTSYGQRTYVTDIPSNSMILSGESKQLRAKLLIKEIQFYSPSEKNLTNHIDAEVLIGIK